MSFHATMSCPRCYQELIWQNDYDLGHDDDQTFTDYACQCGVLVTVPWERENKDQQDGKEDDDGQTDLYEFIEGDSK